MKLCGSLGFKSKTTNQPCGYRIADSADSCPHHAPGGSTAREFQLKGAMASRYNRIPSQIQAGDLDTTEAIRQVYADVIHTAVTMKRIDRSRLELVIKSLNGASTLLQVDAMKELNETLLRSEGHGPALIVLESLKTSRLRRLPGAPGQEVRHGA
jgi:hypothetical protein